MMFCILIDNAVIVDETILFFCFCVCGNLHAAQLYQSFSEQSLHVPQTKRAYFWVKLTIVFL